MTSHRLSPASTIVMRSLSLAALYASVIWGAGLAQEPPRELRLEAGEASNIAWPGLEEAILVRLPSYWTQDRRWPVLFYYHGTGGRPSIRLPVEYTNGDGFVIVGMTYTVRGSVAASKTAQFYRDTARLMKEVRDHLAGRASVDPARVYVGGFSKGGWTAAHFADKYPDLIAGAIILGAGVNPFREGEDLPQLKAKTPVYVGVGQLELNYAVSLQAADHYGGRGARVTFDVYDGLGHRPATEPKSEYLEQWLAIEANRHNLKALKPAFEVWRTALESKLQSADEPVMKYLFLERAGNAPFARFFTKTQKREFSASLEALRKRPSVAAEWELRARYEATRRRETEGGFRMANWEAVIREYASTYHRGPNTTFGKRAGVDALRVLRSIREAVRQRTQSGRDTGEFLEKNAQFIEELDAIPAPELNTYFSNLRTTLTIPLSRPSP